MWINTESEPQLTLQRGGGGYLVVDTLMKKLIGVSDPFENLKNVLSVHLRKLKRTTAREELIV